MHTFILTVQWLIIFLILGEGFIVFENMKNRTHYYLYMNCVAMLLSATGYLLMLFSKSEEAYFNAMLLSWGGKVWVIFSMIFFCINLCSHKPPKYVIIVETAFAVITYAVIITTRDTGLFYKEFRLTQENGLQVFEFTRGPWYNAWTIMVLITIITCLTFLITSMVNEKNRLKKKTYGMIIAALGVEIAIGIPASLPIGKYYDFNEIGYTACSIFILFAVYRGNLLDIESVTKEYIVDEITTGILSVDANGEVAYYNKEVLLAFPEIEKDPVGVIDRIKRSVHTGRPINARDRIFTVDEKELGDKKSGKSKIYVLTDVTMHFRHLEEMEEQKKLAEDANKAKSNFLANMSHEIRTPINTVLGMDEMILRESTERNVKEYAADIQAAGRTLLSIINDVLDISKIESGKLDIVSAEYDIAGLLCDISNMIGIKANDKELKFYISVSPDIPSVLRGDDVRIKQVLLNLLSNAVKYTEKGSIILRVSMKSFEDYSDDNMIAILHFEIEDTGIGIQPDDIDKLFLNFERLEIKRNRNIEGTGLGIPITKELLERMDSFLEVKSEYGKGSTFYFNLKQEIVDKKPIGDFEEKMRTFEYVTDSFEGTVKAPDAKILVVDDNAMNRKVILSLLKPSGIKITEADSGREAIDLASKEKFDIIFMDHMMPGIDGVEAMKIIKSTEDCMSRETPIVVLTANAIVGSKEHYMEEGFDGFLSKPIVYEKLEKTITKLLPDEMIERVKETNAQEAKKGSETDVSDYPVIFGLDWKIAIERLKYKDTVDALLGEFHNTIELQADKLQALKEDLPGSFPDYRIMVHGMKGASGSVGIITLSGMAAVLEKAASNEDIDTINSMHDVFIREWKNYKVLLKEYLGAEEIKNEEKEETDKEVIITLLSMIGTAMEKMDIDNADDAIEKLSAYRLPDDATEEFDILKAAVSQLDQELAEDILQRIKEKIK